MVNYMMYTVDSIENDIIKLINTSDNSIIYINKDILKFNVKENDCIVFDGNNYIKDDYDKKKRLEEIRKKMKKLENK